MAITSITEIMGAGCRASHWDLNSGRAYQRKFRVLTDSQSWGPNMVLQAFGYSYGDVYQQYTLEQDKYAWLHGMDIEEEGEDGIGWIVTLNYGWYDANQAGGGPSQNPLDMPIEVSWSLRDHETVLDTDQNGNAVLNTAGDPFDPPAVIDDPRLVMTVVRNEQLFNIAWVLKYRNAVNSDPFAGFDPLTCKVLNISGRSQWHQDAGWYYQTTYEFEFLAAYIDYDTNTGFRPRILSQGFRAISSVTGLPYHITLKGLPINSPMLLDKNGYLLATNATPYWITYQAYPELPFAIFGFDITAVNGQRSGQNYTPTYPSS